MYISGFALFCIWMAFAALWAHAEELERKAIKHERRNFPNWDDED